MELQIWTHTLTVTRYALLIVVAASASAAQHEPRFPFSRDNKVGFIDVNGQEVIAPRFSNAGNMAHFGEDGRAPVWCEEGGGYIDVAGKWVIGPTKKWGAARRFFEGVAAVLIWSVDVADSNIPGWIDTKGNVILSGAGAPEGARFSEGLMAFRSTGKWGYLDHSFQFAIEPRFDWAGDFHDDLAPVLIGSTLGFINHRGEFVITPKYAEASQFHSGWARVCRGTQSLQSCGFVDATGAEVIPLIYSNVGSWDGARAIVAVNGDSPEMFVIDRDNKRIGELSFREASSYSEGLAAARVGDAWGFVDHSGKWAIPPQFKGTNDFHNGLASVSFKTGFGYVNRAGVIVWSSLSRVPPVASPVHGDPKSGSRDLVPAR